MVIESFSGVKTMTNQFKTKAKKDIRGDLNIESTVMLSGGLELMIYSKKGNNKTIYSQASVSKIEDTGNGWISKVHALYQDFNIRVQVEPCARATQKKLEEFHAKIDFNSIVKQAKEFYKIEG